MQSRAVEKIEKRLTDLNTMIKEQAAIQESLLGHLGELKEQRFVYKRRIIDVPLVEHNVQETHKASE